jgi:hypothetical protein
MSIPKHVYQMLESVVGAENISARDYILIAARPITSTWPYTMGGKPVNPEAVVMPASTEEVQAIIRICNRYHLKHIAMVSLFGMKEGPIPPGTVAINLRRMNKILEINESDRYVVVEPAVRHVQLMPEVMKRGLRYAVPSVGPSCSVMANFLKKGEHHIQHSFSQNNRYLLGYEWVTPTGEIVRVGSMAGDAGWFCPDGPGPSLMGLLQQGHGVVTKAAIGLDGWKGPAQLLVEGHAPTYKIRLPQDCHKVFIFKFSDLDKVGRTMLEMGKAEIGVGVIKFFYATAAVMFTVGANDFWDLWNKGLFQKELPYAMWVYLAGWTPEELAYEERVMWDIVNELGGEPVDESLRKLWEDNMDFFVIVSFLQRVLKLGGGWSAITHHDSMPHMFEVAKTIPEFYYDFIDKGLTLNAPHNFQIIPIEYGHSAHIEMLYFFDRYRPNAERVPASVRQAAMETDLRHGNYATPPPWGANTEKFGPVYSNYNVWLDRIKKAFEPG